jgi:hypothetical protein
MNRSEREPVARPFMIGPRLERLAGISLDGICDLANAFSASVTATSIRTMRMTREPLILIAHNLCGRTWQWPSITAGRMRIRDDIDVRSSGFVAAVAGKRMGSAKTEPANYWFDRRHA